MPVPSAGSCIRRDAFSLWISLVRVAEGLKSRSSRPRPRRLPSLHRAPPTTPSPCCFRPEARTGPGRLPTPKAAGSPRPLTSSAGPARPAAALSLRVREILCPGSGPPSPRAPPRSGSAAGLPWPPQPAATNRCQPQRRRGHSWLCSALILAPPCHLTNKKRRPATTHPSRPPPPVPFPGTRSQRQPTDESPPSLGPNTWNGTARRRAHGSPLPSPAA